MQFGGGKPPLGVVFDTGLSSADDVLALALLHGFDGKNEARIISLSVSRSSLKSAAFVEVIERFYMGGPPGPFSRVPPIGMTLNGKLTKDAPLIQALGEATHSIHHLNDTAEPPAQIRNALTSQFDANAIVVLAGPATNLAQLLDVVGAKEWIAKKAKYLVVAATEYNMKSDAAAAQRLFAEWPTPIFCAGPDAGEAVTYPGSSVDTDFAYNPAHPVSAAYKAAKTMPYDEPTVAMASVLYGIRPSEGYFKLSDPGTISVSAEGHAKLTPSANGKHRMLQVDLAQKPKILGVYTELASAKPAPRTFRPRRQQEQKKDEKK